MATVTARTKYISATDTRGSRYRVTAEGRTRTFPFDYAARDARESAIRKMFPDATSIERVTFGTRDPDRAVWNVELPEAAPAYAKTPEQIACEVIGVDALAGIGYRRDYGIALRAIRADRAQIEK